MNATPDNTFADPEQRIADLERQLAALKAERDQGLQREAATAEVLKVISRSSFDLMRYCRPSSLPPIDCADPITPSSSAKREISIVGRRGRASLPNTKRASGGP